MRKLSTISALRRAVCWHMVYMALHARFRIASAHSVCMSGVVELYSRIVHCTPLGPLHDWLLSSAYHTMIVVSLSFKSFLSIRSYNEPCTGRHINVLYLHAGNFPRNAQTLQTTARLLQLRRSIFPRLIWPCLSI